MRCSSLPWRRIAILCFNTVLVCQQPEPTASATVPATPSQFIKNLRHAEIVERVQSDARTDGDLLLGVDWATAMEALDWGQADFDQPIGTLSAEDRVLLYAYWNQQGHVAELSEAFRQMFANSRPRDPFIVVDLGCGPFTGGLAFAGQLGADETFDYIGVDRSSEMRRFGEKLAAALDGEPEAPRISRQWAPDISSVHWKPPKGWRPVLVIVSFLLASPTLDVQALLAELSRLLRTIGRGEVTVLYTNSAKAGPNRNLPVFRSVLLAAGLPEVANDVGTVQTERSTRALRYALFHRAKQRKLPLGGN